MRPGQVLEVLSRKAHCHTLGFSSVAAYALERCERSVRWVEGARFWHAASNLYRQCVGRWLMVSCHGVASIHWELGPVEQPCVVVHGRERLAAGGGSRCRARGA